jgi:hypothetical protein
MIRNPTALALATARSTVCGRCSTFQVVARLQVFVFGCMSGAHELLCAAVPQNADALPLEVRYGAAAVCAKLRRRSKCEPRAVSWSGLRFNLSRQPSIDRNCGRSVSAVAATAGSAVVTAAAQRSGYLTRTPLSVGVRVAQRHVPSDEASAVPTLSAGGMRA